MSQRELYLGPNFQKKVEVEPKENNYNAFKQATAFSMTKKRKDEEAGVKRLPVPVRALNP